jgi:CheY-like chemotaxis protein
MPLRGLSVLVVEDDRAHRELAQDMLTALGADGMVVVHTECDGEAVQRRRPPGPRAEIDSPG